MKKRTISMILVVIAMISCISMASAAVLRSYQTTVRANEDTGVTSSFEVHKVGRVRFYIWNEEGTEELTVTVHKKGLFGSWGNALTVNGDSSFVVGAGDNLRVDATDDWAKGTYRFEAESANGDPYVYSVDVRELDYTP